MFYFKIFMVEQFHLRSRHYCRKWRRLTD